MDVLRQATICFLIKLLTNNLSVNIFNISTVFCSRPHKTKGGKSFRKFLLGQFVRTKGLEPPRRKTLDPKSSAATNYATCA